jgi:hypothetical protein
MKKTFALTLTLLVSGCGTMINGSRQSIEITTSPTGAECRSGEDKITAPGTLKLPRKGDKDVTCALPGYSPAVARLAQHTSGWIWGNLIFFYAWPLTAAIDSGSGGAYKLEPSSLSLALAPLPASGAAAAAAKAATEALKPQPEINVDELPPARAKVRGHAVIIGVESYRESLPKADFAASDAKVTAEYAKRVLGYPDENVAVLLGDRATRADMEKYIESWLPNRVEKGDEVFVYFSGHGAPDPKTGDAYLVPYDADPTYIQKTGYPLKKLYAELAKLPAKRVVVAMDSCFSGAGGRSVVASGARPLMNVGAPEASGNLVVLSASAANQISNTWKAKKHGLFTYFLLRGLREKDGDVAAAFDALKPEVARVARRELNADQEPQWQGPR